MDPTPLEPQPSAVQLLVHVTRQATPRDVLFVIDRSGAIAPYEQRIDNELVAIASVIERWEGTHFGRAGHRGT